MKTKLISLVLLALYLSSCSTISKSNDTLKHAFKNKFLIGAAINSDQASGKNAKGQQVIINQFSAITPENCMKAEVVHPENEKFNFNLADQFVDFGVKNKKTIIGHTLIWHSQAPKWFFVNEKGDTVSRDEMIQRMKTHITTVMTRYKGKIKGYDVVNEAINDDGSWRQSPFYKIIGKDFIKLAFQFAHEADPNAELYYNDYSMAKPEKRDAVVKMVKDLKEQGVRIDGVGMQGHFSMDFPSVEEEEKSILAFASTGVKVMITEMDISVIPFPQGRVTADVALKYKYDTKMNPYPNGLPDSVATALRERYASFFRMFLKHTDVISRVTLWGVSDADSWRNNWPIFGRSDYPLLFDRNYEPKPVVEDIVKMAKKKN